MKTGIVALIIGSQDGRSVLLDQLSDEQEISILERALEDKAREPLDLVYEHRERLAREDEAFGDYVERLLSQPVVRPEVQKHGVQWLRSKQKIETFQKSEVEASKVIADFAFRLYQEEPDRRDFLLAGPAAQVRIRVFQMPHLGQEMDRDTEDQARSRAA